MRDLIRGRVTGRLDIDRMLHDAGLPEPAADKVRKVVKRTRLWRLEKVDVAHELIAHFLDGRDAGTSDKDLLEHFGDERRTARLIRRAKKRQRPYAWHAFAWTRLGVGVLVGVYALSALYLLTGSPSITTDYLAQLNATAAQVPADQAAWPMYRQALIELDLDRNREWDTPIPYYRDAPAGHPTADSETARQTGPGEMGLLDYEFGDEWKPPFVSSRWDRLDRSLQPDDPGWSETAEFLRQNASTLALIRRAAAQRGLGLEVGFDTDYGPQDRAALGMGPLPEDAAHHDASFRDPDRMLIGVLLPHLGQFRKLAQLLSADAARAAAAGDGDTAYEDIIATLGIARHADEQPLLINGLVRLAIQQIAYRRVQEILTTSADIWSDEQLRDLAHNLAGIEVAPETWLNAERLWFYDYLQRTYTDDGHGGGRITNEGVTMHSQYDSMTFTSGEVSAGQSAVIAAGLPAAAILVAPRGEMRKMYDDLMDRAIVDGLRPLWQKPEEPTSDQKIESLVSDLRTRVRYLPITLFMPSLSAVNRTVQTEGGYREGVMIGLALTLYHRKHGNWPDTLEEMAPTYLPSVPMDRLTGEPLRYLVTENGSVVYSLGVDGDGDDGRVPIDAEGNPDNKMASPRQWSSHPSSDSQNDGDWVLWPVPYPR